MSFSTLLKEGRRLSGPPKPAKEMDGARARRVREGVEGSGAWGVCVGRGRRDG